MHGGRRIITHVGAALYRGGEPERAGKRLSGPPGQIIESVNDTFKGQLDLERHGGHIPDGALTRVLQRILAPTAICHNDPAASLSCVQRGGRSIKL